MNVVCGVASLKKSLSHTVVTIGNFDGLHRGHKKILKTVLNLAKKINGKSVVFTLNPHPSEVLTPHKSLPKINTLEEKTILIENQGINTLILEPFTQQLARKTPEEFFNDILLKKLHPQVIVVGHDFRFGHKRKGDIKLLTSLGAKNNIKIIEVSPFKLENHMISSTLIREAIHNGEMEKAHLFLGRPFFLAGTVISGSGRGKKINTPTANLYVGNRLIPGDGVYIIQTEYEGKLFPSVGSVGRNITFSDTEPPTLEVFLLNFHGELYGKKLIIHYLKKIRAMKKFPSPQELKEAIQADIQEANKFFNISN